MSDETKKTAAERIAAANETLAKKRAARAAAREEQEANDLEARIRLEEEHGPLAAVSASRFEPGQPTMAFVRKPTVPEYKRYKTQVYGAAHEKGKRNTIGNPTLSREAQELLAKSCWVYPETEEARDAMLATYPGILSPLSQAATALAEGATEDEGKD
jgi:hypothetical protein